MILVHFQGKPFITVIQVYAPTTDAEEAEVDQFYEDLHELLEPTPKKDVLFIIGGYIHTMEYYTAIKKNSFESILMRWMKLEPIIQSEVSQKEKHQYIILTHIYAV